MASLANDSLLPPLVVRNKRGRKVDETLPKSHQREVQRQFRARRTSHLADLEKRVSLLERENAILRLWAGIAPSTRPLLGRGPTGCDTTRPLIADESDEEIQLFLEENRTRESNWAETPAARNSFTLDQTHHQPYPDPAGIHTSLQSQTRPSSSVGIVPDGQVGVPAQPYDKVYDQSYPEQQQQQQQQQKYKPHPLYDHRPLEAHFPPPPPPRFDQNSSAQSALVKREAPATSYATPTPSLLAQNATPSQSISQTSVVGSTPAAAAPATAPSPGTPHPGLAHSTGYFIPHQHPLYSRSSVDQYALQQGEITPTHTGNGAGYANSYQMQWTGSYLQQQQQQATTNSNGQVGSRRSQPALMTPIMPTPGPSSGNVSGSNSSPASQPNSGADHHSSSGAFNNNASTNGNSNTTSGSANLAESAYLRQHQHQRGPPVSYALSTVVPTTTPPGYSIPPTPSSAAIGMYATHAHGHLDAGFQHENDGFRQ